MHLPISDSIELAVVVGCAVERVQTNGSRQGIVVDVTLVDRDDRRTFVGGDDVRLAVPFTREAGYGLGRRRCDGKNAKHAPSLAEWYRDLDHTLSDVDTVGSHETGVDLECVA